jgi:hypothetical protein
MAAGTYNIAIEQGATYDQTFTWTVNAAPVNLTGYAARMQFRQSAANPTVNFDIATGGSITLGGAAGTIRIQITASNTSALAAGNYVYDLELQSGTGVVTRLLQGTVTVSPEVTR